jgi:hypothetical protein
MKGSSGRDWQEGKEESSRGEGHEDMASDGIVFREAGDELEILQRTG